MCSSRGERNKFKTVDLVKQCGRFRSAGSGKCSYAVDSLAIINEMPTPDSCLRYDI